MIGRGKLTEVSARIVDNFVKSNIALREEYHVARNIVLLEPFLYRFRMLLYLLQAFFCS